LTRFAYSRPDASGVDAAVAGVLEFALVNREEVDGRIRVIHSFKATLEKEALPNGGFAGVAEVDLPSTGPTQGVRVVEKLQPLKGSREYTVIVPDPAPLAATDLIEVDPSTLLASEEAVAAWQGVTDTIAGFVNQASASVNDADEARVSASEFAQSAALSAGGADAAAAAAGTAAADADTSASAALGHANTAALSASQAAGSADVASDAATLVTSSIAGLVFAATVDAGELLLLESGAVSEESPGTVAIQTSSAGTLRVPTTGEVAATYVSFRDTDGNPLTARHVVITVNATTGEIADIVAEAL
jgi:hypothetical protein